MTPTWKAALDLTSLFLIWAGTAAITLGGVPALIGDLVRFNDQPVTFKGQPLTFGHTPDSQVALRRYRRWAVPGFAFITLGMIWQAAEPFGVILEMIQKWWSGQP